MISPADNEIGNEGAQDLVAALRQEVNPNWPAVFYIGLFALLGAKLAGVFGAPIAAKWQRAAFLTGGLFAGLTYALPLVLDAAGWQGKKALIQTRALKVNESGEFL